MKVRHRPGPAIGKITGARLDVLGNFELTTGPRLGEVLALRDRRLDLDRKQIKVSEAREETKAIGSVFKAPEINGRSAHPDPAISKRPGHAKPSITLAI